MSDDPHDHLLLQIRGAVAEYERILIAEHMRRARLAKLRSGGLRKPTSGVISSSAVPPTATLSGVWGS